MIVLDPINKVWCEYTAFHLSLFRDLFSIIKQATQISRGKTSGITIVISLEIPSGLLSGTPPEIHPKIPPQILQ